MIAPARASVSLQSRDYDFKNRDEDSPVIKYFLDGVKQKTEASESYRDKGDRRNLFLDCRDDASADRRKD